MIRQRFAQGFRLLVILAGLSAFGADANNSDLLLWYRQPAGAWNQALPVGNGRLAAMVFGDPHKEHIQLNEDTIWSGEKRDRSNPEAAKAVPEIRRLLMEGHPADAQKLADKAMISIPKALPVYEKQEESMQFYYADMVKAIDVVREDARLSAAASPVHAAGLSPQHHPLLARRILAPRLPARRFGRRIHAPPPAAQPRRPELV